MRTVELFRSTLVAGTCCLLLALPAGAAVVGDWHFDEATSGNVGTVLGSIVDSSGNGLDGYGVGATTPAYVAGCPYEDNIAALNFTTADDEVWIPDNPALTFADGTSFTIEAIIRSTIAGDTNTRGIVVKRHASNVDGGFWLRAYNQKLNVSVGDLNGRVTLDGTTTIMDQQWHHVALVYDAVGDTLSLYVDHKLDAAPVAAVLGEIVTLDPANTPLIIGGWITTDANRQWRGDIDMVRISTGVLTPEEFVQFPAGACCMNDGTCSLTLDSGCAGHWRGPATDCATVTCPIVGSCCQLDGTCTETTEAACNGHWGGPGTTCAAATCLGSCCAYDGSCTDTTAAACTGTWGGYGTSCATTDCLGACCMPDGTCTQTTAAACTGEWHGPGSTCATVNCRGACCGASCTETTQAACTSEWQGSGSHCTQPCPPAPIGFWTFNEMSAGNYAGVSILDVSGNGLNGTAESTVALPVYAAGNPEFTNDTALRFGPGSTVTIPDSDALDFPAGTNVTIEAVVRSTTLAGNRYIVYKRMPSSSGSVRPGFWFRTIAKTVNGLNIQALEGIIIGTTGNDRISGTVNVADGLWHHVAMVYNATATPPTLSVYVDYQLDGTIPCLCSSTSCGAINSPSPMRIGSSAPDDTTSFWPGDIDFVRMTRQALVPTQFMQPQSPTIGACCYNDGTCANTTLAACTGHWQGANTTCETAACPQPGACCLGDGTCALTLASECLGTFFGPGTTCGDVNCAGACCQFDGSCVEVGPANCVGQWRGLGTHCADQTCVALGETIGYWKFDEATSGNADTAPGSIIDSAAHGLDGYGIGNPPPAYVAGSQFYTNGSALNFTTAVDAIYIPDNPLLNFNDGVGFTLEALIRTSSTSGTRYIAIKRGLSSDPPPTRPAFFLRTIATTVNDTPVIALDSQIRDVKGGYTQLTGKTNLADGNWHHVAMAYDAQGDTLTLYVDYQVDATDVCFRSDLNNPAPLAIGELYPQGSGGSWAGDMDFVRISLGAISPSMFIQRRNTPDFDRNGIVDGVDLAFFIGCVTGPEVGPPVTPCDVADLDLDGDVDQTDYGKFQRCYGGPVTDACLN